MKSKDNPRIRVLADTLLSSRETMFASLQKKLIKAQDRMKHFADKHHKEVSFAVGDNVVVKLRPYRQSSVTRTWWSNYDHITNLRWVHPATPFHQWLLYLFACICLVVPYKCLCMQYAPQEEDKKKIFSLPSLCVFLSLPAYLTPGMSG